MTEKSTTQLWKIGDLAERTGVSVRTLHYYEELELLRPSHRTPAGHRLYTASDVRRLSQVKSLRQLGFSLDEIKTALSDENFSPLQVVERHLAEISERIAAEQRILDRLRYVAERLRGGEDVGTDELFKTIEAMTMYEKYFSPEQLQELQARRQAMGEDALRDSQKQWADLIAAVRREMQAGTDPKSEAVQQLAAQWRSLIAAFTGGKAEIAASVKNLYRGEPEVRNRFGLDEEITKYIGKALAPDKS